MLRVSGSVAEAWAGATQTLELYYASDVHGSDQCWRKFLGAGRFYGVHALIMGGDLTGKAIVPIARTPMARSAPPSWARPARGRAGRARPAGGRDPLQRHVSRGSRRPARSRGHVDAESRAALFEQVMLDELRRWIALADERMAAHGIEVHRHAGQRRPVELRRGDRGGGARAGLRRPGRASATTR